MYCPPSTMAAIPGATISIRAIGKTANHAGGVARRIAGIYARLQEIGLHVVSVPEVEADDVLATAVRRWLKEQRGEAVVASTDKDLHV